MGTPFAHGSLSEMLKPVMDSAKTQIIQDIESAKAHLESALNELMQLPVPSGDVEMATQTLGSYVVLAKGTVGLLSEELREYPVRDVHTWLDGLARGTDLMEKLIEQIQSGNVAQHELKWEEVEIATLMRRLCGIYHESATRRGIKIDFDAAVSTSRAWTDRLVAASLLQQILADALRRAPENSTVIVHVEELQDRIITSIQEQEARVGTNESRHLEKNEDLSRSEEPDLTIPRKSVERLGGELWCEFHAGEGIRVCASLPKTGQRGQLTDPKKSDSPS